MFWILAVVGIVGLVYLLALCLAAAARRADRERERLIARIMGHTR